MRGEETLLRMEPTYNPRNSSSSRRFDGVIRWGLPSLDHRATEDSADPKSSLPEGLRLVKPKITQW